MSHHAGLSMLTTHQTGLEHFGNGYTHDAHARFAVLCWHVLLLCYFAPISQRPGKLACAFAVGYCLKSLLLHLCLPSAVHFIDSAIPPHNLLRFPDGHD